jgi:hypothetical protein
MKAFWQYYLTVTLFNIIACIIAVAGTQNIYWLPVLFCTFGIAIGILVFNYFFKHQYYFYHNLGYTKQKLALKTLCINAIIAIPVLALLIIFL